MLRTTGKKMVRMTGSQMPRTTRRQMLRTTFDESVGKLGTEAMMISVGNT